MKFYNKYIVVCIDIPKKVIKFYTLVVILKMHNDIIVVNIVLCIHNIHANFL